MNYDRKQRGQTDNVEVDDLLMAIKKLGNMIVLLIESDNYYRVTIADLLFMVCAWYENNKKINGDDFLLRWKANVNKDVFEKRGVVAESEIKKTKKKE